MNSIIKPHSRRARVLTAISSFWEVHGYLSSVREIGILTGISSTSLVVRHLRVLEAHGHIKRDSYTSRSIRLTDLGRMWLEGNTGE